MTLLSDQLKQWRVDRPDEWKMDEFIRQAEELESDRKMKDWDNWKPTADDINTLPEKIKAYVCGLETLCDPAGIIAENIFLKDEMSMFMAALRIKEKEVQKCPECHEECDVDSLECCPICDFVFSQEKSFLEDLEKNKVQKCQNCGEEYDVGLLACCPFCDFEFQHKESEEKIQNPCVDCGKEWNPADIWPCPHCGNEIPF